MRAIDQFTKNGEFVRNWPSIRMAADSLNIFETDIGRVVDTKYSSGGFMWKESLDKRNFLTYNPKVLYSEKQRDDFNRKIPKYMPVLYKLLNNFDFVNAFNYDDYLQEALVMAWIRFYTYEPEEDSFEDGKKFGAYFKITCKWGIIRYFHYLKDWKTREYEDKDDNKSGDIDDSDARTIALYHCLENLPEEDLKIIMCYMVGSDWRKYCQDLGITKDVYFHSVLRIKNILRDKITYYLTGVKDIRIKMGSTGGNPTPVEQFDMQGKFVAWYPSIRGAAKEAGFNPSSISQAITKRIRAHRGFMWKTSRYRNSSEARAARKDLVN